MNSGGTSIIATSYIFGASAIVFATMPFCFIIIKGILKSSNNQHSASIMKSIGLAYMVHCISCIFFMIIVKSLDKLNKLYSQYGLEEKIFPIFWSRQKEEIFSMAGASGTPEDEGAYLTLYIIQVAFDFFILFVPIILIILACSYAILQAKKDSYKYNYIGIASWMGISIIFVILLFTIWAKIANIAMFIPAGEDLIIRMFNIYKEVLEMAL